MQMQIVIHQPSQAKTPEPDLFHRQFKGGIWLVDNQTTLSNLMESTAMSSDIGSNNSLEL